MSAKDDQKIDYIEGNASKSISIIDRNSIGRPRMARGGTLTGAITEFCILSLPNKDGTGTD